MSEEEKTTEDPKKTIWKKLVEFHLKYHWLMLGVILLGTLFFGYQVSKVKIHTDFFQLYPPGHPYIKLYKEYRKMFGTANVMSIVVEVEKGNIYTIPNLKKIDNITKDVLSTRGVNPQQLISITHPRLKDIRVHGLNIDVRPLFWPKFPENDDDLKILKNKVYTNDNIRGVWITPDDKSTLIQAGFWEEGVDLRALFKTLMDIQRRYEDTNTKIYMTGYPVLYAWIANYTPELYTIFGVTLVVLILMLWWYFRTLVGVLLPISSMFISGIWGLGFVVTMGLNVDPLILVVPFLLSARALSHSVQSMERFYEEYVMTPDKRTAIVNAYAYLYKPGILGLATDALGVATIAIATIPIMRNLAIYGSFWVLTIYFSSMVLHPVLLSYLPVPKTKHHKALEALDKTKDRDEIRSLTARHGDKFFLWIGKGFLNLAAGNRKWRVVAVCIAIIFVGGFLSLTYLKVGDVSAGKAVLYPDHPYNIAYDKVNREFFGANQMIVIAEGKKERAMVEEDSLRIVDDMATGALDIPAVGGAMTIVDTVKRISRMYHEQEPRWGVVPTNPMDIASYFFLIGASMAPGELDRLISTNYKNATVTIYFRDYTNQTLKHAIAYLKQYIKENPAKNIEFRLAGGILGILAAVNEEVEYSYWINMALIFSTIFIFCWITYRTWLGALVLWIPLLLCQVLCDMLMLAVGIDLNINSLPVASIGVGVGVDYGIYVLSRLAEEYQFSKGDFEKARYMAITSTGKAVIFTALTLFISVIFFVFADFKFQAEMAILLGFLLLANMFGSLLVVPSLVACIGPEKILPKYKV